MTQTANQRKMRITDRKATVFTIVELLVVVSIISILMTLLLPALRNAKRSANKIGCLNNLKNIGTAHHSYISDWDGYATPNYNPCYWEDCLSTLYLGMKTWKPNTNTTNNNLFICPENPKGNSNGNYPSYGRNVTLGDWGDDKTVKLLSYKTPSAKVFLVDSALSDSIGKAWFFPNRYDPNNGHISLRHVGDKCCMIFLDGHASSYGTPPIPIVCDWGLGAQWTDPSTAPPAGL